MSKDGENECGEKELREGTKGRHGGDGTEDEKTQTEGADRKGECSGGERAGMNAAG